MRQRGELHRHAHIRVSWRRQGAGNWQIYADKRRLEASHSVYRTLDLAGTFAGANSHLSARNLGYQAATLEDVMLPGPYSGSQQQTGYTAGSRRFLCLGS